MDNYSSHFFFEPFLYFHIGNCNFENLITFLRTIFFLLKKNFWSSICCESLRDRMNEIKNEIIKSHENALVKNLYIWPYPLANGRKHINVHKLFFGPIFNECQVKYVWFSWFKVLSGLKNFIALTMWQYRHDSYIVFSRNAWIKFKLVWNYGGANLVEYSRKIV